MKTTKHKLAKKLNKKVNDVLVNKIQHQSDTYSCGVYSLYYILSRLENIPSTAFQHIKVPDESMHKFKEHLFR
jgi:hypothetical protein